MKARIFCFGFLLIFFLPAALNAKVEFSGFVSDAELSQFSLADSESGQTACKKIGGTFAGYTLISFDPASETLKLKNAGGELNLKLKGSLIRTAPSPGSVPPALAERGITIADLVVRMDANVQIYLSPGVQKTPIHKRYVEISVDTPNGGFSPDSDDLASGAITRESFPEAAQSLLTDADISAINRHLAIVRPRWLPEKPPAI
jgi:hypothetical protein